MVTRGLGQPRALHVLVQMMGDIATALWRGVTPVVFQRPQRIAPAECVIGNGTEIHEHRSFVIQSLPPCRYSPAAGGITLFTKRVTPEGAVLPGSYDPSARQRSM